MPPFVAQLPQDRVEKLRLLLEAQGFALSVPPHTCFSGKKAGLSCTLYTSGKLVVQGKNQEEFIRYHLEPEILETFTFGYKPEVDMRGRIGVDESGKGDFFGPLCTAGLFAAGEEVEALVALGVRDSKSLSDSAVRHLAGQIRQRFVHQLVVVGPEKYNALYARFRNLNTLLGWCHATVVEGLVEKSGCREVLIDQFANERVVEQALARKGVEANLVQRTKAESDPVVAGASILARAAFLEGLERLGREAGVTLPKGASSQTVTVARSLATQHGKEWLVKFAKLHFKTFQQL